MSTQIKNINEMRKAFIIAHNDGNQKAIDRQRVSDAGIDNSYFVDYKNEVKKLRDLCNKYVLTRIAQRTDSSITNKKITTLRNRIFPQWKNILSMAEESQTENKLHCSEYDVDSLATFALKFMNTKNGTVETLESEQIFRKKVECLIGCIMAKNAVLNDVQRDKLQKYYGLQRSINNAQKKIEELQESNKNWRLMLKQAENENNFKEMIEKNIRKNEAEIRETEQNIKKNEADMNELRAEVEKIETSIKKIEL